MQTSTTAVILLNMGGPARLQDVRPFLYNLFSDREIIRLGPALLQRPIAWYIARKRAPKSSATYAAIGGGSPITAITLAQQLALQKSLSQYGDFTVVTAMRYWQPRAAEALATLASRQVDRIIALSLYPHYSRATTGSSLKEMKQRLRSTALPQQLHEIDAWPDHPLYVRCLADRIREGLEKFGGEDVQIVYSAHSLPTSFIAEGDPYVRHLNRTISAVEQQTGRSGLLCYQSRSGPVEWLSPSTPETIARLGSQGRKNILMVPISFVSDHVETLYEIEILYRQSAAAAGLRLETTRALNDDADFIACLRDLVLGASI